MSEIAVIAGSSVAGAVSAAILERLSRVKAKAAKQDKPLTAARAELASLLFEKTLAAEAITRVYEAAQDGKIDRLERDRLLIKYKQDLDSLNERIAHLQPVADYADLAEARSSLVSLLETKISTIDSKMAEMSKAGARPIVVEKVQVMPIPEKVKDDSDAKQIRAEEKNIEQLQKEIMQALVRL
ncbi:MAG: hypothetical protein ACREAY_12105, partial [Nitrososphaera sp.]|uniref:hypothetical protein n=1 Tax=Nitrososphaera sp. TaxID=1971748 RepID=UPI003D6EF995